MAQQLARLIGLLLLPVLLAGCDNYPRDPERTTAHVRSSHRLQVGLVAGEDSTAQAAALARSIAAFVGAEASVMEASAAILIPRLETGELQLVLGRFAADSPWKERTAFSTPYGAEDPPDSQAVLRALVRSGENRWLMEVERAMERQP